jgi:hypothetical protein
MKGAAHRNNCRKMKTKESGGAAYRDNVQLETVISVHQGFSLTKNSKLQMTAEQLKDLKARVEALGRYL